jgi:hypothetical protein
MFRSGVAQENVCDDYDYVTLVCICWIVDSSSSAMHARFILLPSDIIPPATDVAQLSLVPTHRSAP